METSRAGLDKRCGDRFRNIAINASVLLSSIAVLVFFLEVALSIAKVNNKSTIRFLPGKGVTYIPGAYYRHTKEGFSEGYFNSHGFRDSERAYEKPLDTFRILVLGDSYVEALQVALEDTFPALLEKRLNEKPRSMKFEVLAMGQSGFGTADEFMRYQNFGVAFSPDLVILAFLTGNDIRNNSKILNRASMGFYFVFDLNRKLVLDRSTLDDFERELTFPKRFFQIIKTRSYLAALISERLYLFREGFRQSSFESDYLRRSSRDQDGVLDPFSDLNIYRPNLTELWREAFDISNALVLKFKDSVASHGAGFVLVTLPSAEQVHPRIQHQLNERYHLLFDYGQPDRLLKKFAAQHAVDCLNLTPVFLKHHLKTGKSLHGFGSMETGHWNENGHALAAEEMFRFLHEKRLVPLD